MHKLIISIILVFLSFSVLAESINKKWLSLNEQYVDLITSQKYDIALELAIELNSIDPSDTKSLLYIVFASIKADKKIPSWVFEKPWPNATNQDVLNKQMAEQLSGGT